MKTDIKPGKYNLVKTAVIFIAAALALTFFSRSFYNYRLPVVKAVLPKQGKLIFTVEGKTELDYSRVSTFYADMDGRVNNILVKSGDEVKKGQLLMQLKSALTNEVQDITAAEDGIITFVGVKKGMYVSSMQNTILYNLAEKSEEWIANLFIDEEQLKSIDKESIPTLNIVDLNETITGEITSILSYTDQTRTGYLVEILIRSNDAGLAGKRVNVTIKKESRQYDTLIPAPALHKDTEGYYVLTLQKDDGILGNGYIAKRMSVDLLDSDETYCAVRGLPADEYVIVTATNKIENGSSVFYEGDGAQ